MIVRGVHGAEEEVRDDGEGVPEEQHKEDDGVVVTTCVIYSGQTPAQIFVSSPENLRHRFHWLPRAMSLIFRQYLLLYFIAAQGNIYYIPLLPKAMFIAA